MIIKRALNLIKKSFLLPGTSSVSKKMIKTASLHGKVHSCGG